MKETPNYYAILPANVRYDKRLTSTAKILYAEITALSNKEGYCWASNNYFSELYELKDRSISQNINSLKNLGYLKIEVSKEEGNMRRIWIVDNSVNNLTKIGKKQRPLAKNLNTSSEKLLDPSSEKLLHNITSINTINNNGVELNSTRSQPVDNSIQEEEKPATKETNSDIKKLIDFYHNAFVINLKEKPLITKKDIGVVQGLLKHYPLDKLCLLLQKFFVTGDDFVRRNGYSLAIFSTQINRLLTAGAKQNKESYDILRQKAIKCKIECSEFCGVSKYGEAKNEACKVCLEL